MKKFYSTALASLLAYSGSILAYADIQRSANTISIKNNIETIYIKTISDNNINTLITKLTDVLISSGLGTSNVISIKICLTNMDDMKGILNMFQGLFSTSLNLFPSPALEFIGVSSLPNDATIQISAIAVR